MLIFNLQFSYTRTAVYISVGTRFEISSLPAYVTSFLNLLHNLLIQPRYYYIKIRLITTVVQQIPDLKSKCRLSVNVISLLWDKLCSVQCWHKIESNWQFNITKLMKSFCRDISFWLQFQASKDLIAKYLYQP